MGIDWEEIFGDENSENFEDHFSSPDNDISSDPDERPATRKDAIRYLEVHRLADADKTVLNFMARLAGYSSFAPYILACLKNAKTDGIKGFPDMWTDAAGNEHPVYSHLFHANSVVTSVDYIRNAYIPGSMEKYTDMEYRRSSGQIRLTNCSGYITISFSITQI